jgi:hypothetical protein
MIGSLLFRALHPWKIHGDHGALVLREPDTLRELCQRNQIRSLLNSYSPKHFRLRLGSTYLSFRSGLPLGAGARRA